MNSNFIQKLIILGITGALAILIGSLLVTDQFNAIIYIALTIVFFTGIALGKNIWLLIPLTAALNITIMIPGKPTIELLGQVMFIGFFIPVFLLRKLVYRPRLTELEVWMICLGACILQVYMRNPIGLNILGGDTIGGRPYMLVGITFVVTFLLVGLHVEHAKLKWILILEIVGGLSRLAISFIGMLVPTFGAFVGSRTELDPQQMSEGMATSGLESASRVGFLGNFSVSLATWISAFRNPLRACFHPLFGSLIFISFIAAGISGFRNKVIAVGFTYLVALYYRGGMKSVFLSCMMLVVTLSMISVINTATPLPSNIQRAMSFFPGTWDSDIKIAAQASVDWRVEMWKEVMLTNRWISNKWLGDGLGFTAQELRIQSELREKKSRAIGISGFDAHREGILANGNYHSGPIQTIRTIGYLGLAVLLLAQFRLAVHAHHIIRRCEGTSSYPLSLLIGIPIIWAPAFFILVFGTFLDAATSLLFGIAMVRMLENNLRLEASPSTTSTPPVSRSSVSQA
jgi:hypothetical protein